MDASTASRSRDGRTAGEANHRGIDEQAYPCGVCTDHHLFVRARRRSTRPLLEFDAPYNCGILPCAAGTTNWGDNQCKNDKDGTVDSDERLRITGAGTGNYDARLKDVSGRTCIVRDIKLEAGEVFSIEEKDLISCDR